MSELPPGDSFHNFQKKLHAYVQMKDLNDSVKFVARLALDRARRENYNPRQGKLTITFDDNGASAVWEPTP
jgi:hypothetical protein